jgi:predicted ATPase
MIQLIEALNYRCLKYIKQPLEPFQVLVGPNASGKTTFLDVVGFLGGVVSSGLDAAVGERTQNFQDLLFGRTGRRFELAIEALIPEDRKKLLRKMSETIRYEVQIGLDDHTGEIGILGERVWLKPKETLRIGKPDFFPTEILAPDTVFVERAKKDWQRVLTKAHGGNDNFYVEVREAGGGKGWFPSIRLGPRKSALANLPEDESRFPASTWLKRILVEGIQQFVLNSLLIRKSSPPGQPKRLKPDGSNLPWAVWELEREKDRSNLQRWIEHVRTALPDIEAVRTVELQENRHRYLILKYQGGLEAPSWMVSDGTLRLLALTIPAYLPDFRGICLIEEPENGIHPSAVETVFQSLSSIYEAQVLLATHSPVILSVAEPKDLLCFKKNASGATDIVRGDAHPALRTWKGEVSLGHLFAGGVLG